MQGIRSLGLPLETPLQSSSTRSRIPPPPILEEGALSDLFGSLSLDTDSTSENSSNSIASSSSSSSEEKQVVGEEEQVVGEEEQENNPPMEQNQQDLCGPQLIMRKLAKPMIPIDRKILNFPQQVHRSL